MLCSCLSTAAGGGDAHPSVIALSWYMNECNKVFAGTEWWGWANVDASDSWNVAYGEMSSDVSVKQKN